MILNQYLFITNKFTSKLCHTLELHWKPRAVMIPTVSTPVHTVACYKSRCRQWASYQIRKIAGCACTGNAGNVFHRHRLQRKLLLSDPGIHHGTCVTHVLWCMPGSLTRGGETFPAFPAHEQPAYLVRGPWRQIRHRDNCRFSVLGPGDVSI